MHAFFRGVPIRGGLPRDHEGHLICSYFKEFREVDALTKSLHELQLYKDTEVEKLLVDVDLEILFRLLNSGMVSKWRNVLQRIRVLLKDLSSSISHIFGKPNSSLDKLAGLRFPSELFCSSIHQLPGIVIASIQLDIRKFSFVHM